MRLAAPLLPLACLLSLPLVFTNALDLRSALKESRRMASSRPVLHPNPGGSADVHLKPLPVNTAPDALTLQDWKNTGVNVIGPDRLDSPAGKVSESWSYCGDADDVLHIKRLELIPDPPKRGEDLQIDGAAILDKDIVQGAVALVRIKIGLIKLPDQRIDLCQELKNQGNERLKCPIKAGEINVLEVVSIPDKIPQGRYMINARVFNADGEHVTCVNARFVF